MASNKLAYDGGKKDSLNDLVTIITPTINRPEFISRFLYYYSSIGFTGDILIGDSSDENRRVEVLDAVKKYEKKVSVKYAHYPSSAYPHSGSCVKALNENIKTPYAIYCGDDDFLVPDGIAQCVDFLEKNKDFIAACGKRIVYQLDREGPSGKVVAMATRNSPDLTGETSLERLNTYIVSGRSTQYSIFRSEAWVKMYKDADAMPSRYLGEEFYPCCISLISGKIEMLDVFLVLFQQNMKPIFNWNNTALFSLVNSPEWAPSVKKGNEVLIDTLLAHSAFNRDQASQFIVMALWQHVLLILNGQFNALSQGKALRSGLDLVEGKKILDEFMMDSNFLSILKPALKALAGLR
ncbi:TIGR00180 family glycosyltransferase [Maridesulfovibrio zosterae]|uniref:TIGR00180 family glycosyltransferase n=1 Tax=Maridesulfovibrio zosterae TaxID=82171 RepID=UPI00041CE3A1|nr:TIGR00180 family glycosyltransferase [Maridesulfovibrio zosterae]